MLPIRLFGRKASTVVASKRMVSSQLRPVYDMVITGGGMVGCALAALADMRTRRQGNCAIAKISGSSSYFEGKSILLVDNAKPKVWETTASPDFDIRVSTISPGSMKMMERMKAWSIISGLRAPQEVKQLRVWDACSKSSIHFECPNVEENVAHVVENTALLTAFWRRLEQMNNVETIFYGGVVKQVHVPFGAGDDFLASVTLENGTSIRTKLLVGADGFKSVVRQAMDVHELSWNYDQKGVVCTLELAESTVDNRIAWQRFTPNGPIALLPLNRTTSNLIWTTTTLEANRLLGLQPRDFIDELNSALFTTDTEYSSVNSLLTAFLRTGQEDSQCPPAPVALQSQLAAFPLGFMHATNYVKPGVALVGDAAHRVHPLAGQGVNLGFRDVACLVEQLEQAIGRGEQLGSLSVLRPYESQRQWENLSVMMTVDGLNRLYGTSSFPVVLIRSLGLNTVNRFSFLKDFFMKRAAA